MSEDDITRLIHTYRAAILGTNYTVYDYIYWGDYIEHPVNYYYREDNHPSVIMYCCSKIYFLNDSCEEEYICEESIGNPYMQ